MSAAVTTAGSSARATAVEPVTSTTPAPFSCAEDEPARGNAATGTTNLGGPRRSLPGSVLKRSVPGALCSCRVPGSGICSQPVCAEIRPPPGGLRCLGHGQPSSRIRFRRMPGSLAAWSGGQRPGAVPAGQPSSGQVAQVQRGGAALEPGVVLGGAAVAELEAASPPGGHLGDGAFHVGPAGHVVLAQPAAGGPVRAGGAQQVVAVVQDELAAGLASGAALTQRAVPAQGAEGGDPGPAERHGAASGAGHRALLLADGEIIDGEPALDRGTQRPGLDHRLMAGLVDRIAQVTGAVGGIAVPGQ